MNFEIDGIPFEVDYNIDWGSPQTWDDPGEQPCVDHLVVTLGGHDVTGLLSKETIDQIEEACFEHAQGLKSEY